MPSLTPPERLNGASRSRSAPKVSVARKLSKIKAKAKVKARAKAGPRRKDSAVTRQGILTVATEEFARYGLTGARVDRMAQKMAVSKRMIYYYFKSKELLYQAVLENSYRGIRGRDAEINFDKMDPASAIREMVAATLDHEHTHPEFINLVINENLHRAKFLKKASEIKRSNAVIIQQLEKILARGRKTGQFRNDIDAIELHMVVSALCIFRIANRHTFQALFGRDLMNPAIRDHLRELICDTVLRLLAR